MAKPGLEDMVIGSVLVGVIEKNRDETVLVSVTN